MPYKGIDWSVEIHNAIEMGKQEMTLQQIGEKYGVSRQRIKQVFKKHGVDPATIGVPLRSKRTREEKAATYFKKWGDVDQDLYDEKRIKYRAKKANAERIGIEFTIPFSEIEFPTHCPVLGMELDYFAEGVQENSVSFERLNHAVGYVVGNVKIVSWRANRIKNNGTAAEHRLIADYIDKHTEVE